MYIDILVGRGLLSGLKNDSGCCASHSCGCGHLSTDSSTVSLWLDVLEAIESNYIYVLYIKTTYLNPELQYVSPSEAKMTLLTWLS